MFVSDGSIAKEIKLKYNLTSSFHVALYTNIIIYVWNLPLEIFCTC
jgi:hypothetical protein